eukprot:6459106-Amphidinium_carterae.1
MQHPAPAVVSNPRVEAGGSCDVEQPSLKRRRLREKTHVGSNYHPCEEDTKPTKLNEGAAIVPGRRHGPKPKPTKPRLHHRVANQRR